MPHTIPLQSNRSLKLNTNTPAWLTLQGQHVLLYSRTVNTASSSTTTSVRLESACHCLFTVRCCISKCHELADVLPLALPVVHHLPACLFHSGYGWIWRSCQQGHPACHTLLIALDMTFIKPILSCQPMDTHKVVPPSAPCIVGVDHYGYIDYSLRHCSTASLPRRCALWHTADQTPTAMCCCNDKIAGQNTFGDAGLTNCLCCCCSCFACEVSSLLLLQLLDSELCCALLELVWPGPELWCASSV